MVGLKETIDKGRPARLPCIVIDNKEIVITGKLIKTARLNEEWYEDVDDPEKIVAGLRECGIRVDLFTFWQRLPETEPKYSYRMEWEYIAALPIESYDKWWTTQIRCKTRNLIRNAAKKGVTVRETYFSDAFVQGMTDIFNETPVRQGKRYWHYGKDFETVKQQFSRYLYREDLAGAYYNDELIGFLFLGNAGRYALTGQILAKIKHRDKSTNNALIAKAVEMCHKKGLPYLVYCNWEDSTLAEFKRHNGFEKIALPRYYIPLTAKGRIALRLKLHKGLRTMIPQPVKESVRKAIEGVLHSGRYRKDSTDAV